jgi:hypothetical protein
VAGLEYRLQDDDAVLYAYPGISLEEQALRLCCDYWVKDGTVYEKMTAWTEEDGRTVIRVCHAEEETAYPDGREAPDWRGIRVELREFREEALFYPVIRTFEFDQGLEALALLLSTNLSADGRRWEKTSAEVDEDRAVYVYYAQEVR